MIEFIKGKIHLLTPTSVVLETVGGVGYGINISLNTFTALEQATEALLYVHESIREDAYVLYGFATREEREAFRLLTSVNGVGPNSARLVVSALSAAEFQNAILTEDVRTLKGIKGIGQKTAERIVVELKDKMAKMQVAGTLFGAAVVADPRRGEALDALEVLGYNKSQASKAVDKILAENSDMKVEQIVKAAFRLL
ncbi:MAG: Holliday junction branch migration protein RuvA [Bacteroidales bacterium]|nr:Holliday junction branch migration protein RuvA [Bacteroidales bacterium]